MRPQRLRAIGILSVGAGLCAGVAVAGFWGGFRLNLTPSYPLGIWRIQTLERTEKLGDLVFICSPSTPAFELGLRRGYMTRGLCPGGSGPLIKTIVAVAGQDVTITDDVSIDGTILPHSAVRSMDFEGRPLSSFAGGRVPTNAVFLHSDFGGSYDSRYFGPVPTAGILGLASPVFVWTP
ncbi:MAG: conjugative transfer signal peptidase TraF [Devosia sp.]